MDEKTRESHSTLLEIVEYRLRFPRPVSPGEASHLRGFFGQTFATEVLLHHHNHDGSTRYAYPRVQFKVLNRAAYLIGLAEGAPLVTRLWGEVDQARIGTENLPVLESRLTRRREYMGEVPNPILYRFRTPWLGLNQDNHRAYSKSPCSIQQQALLERVLAGNCLALAKAFGHHVKMRLSADASDLRPCMTRLKGVEMLGFLGFFRINYRIPNKVGIGKSVSRGFGTVERDDGEEDTELCSSRN